MRSDRYTRVVLTVIAVALCVIALPRLETSEVMAASGQLEAVAAGEPQVQTGPRMAPEEAITFALSEIVEGKETIELRAPADSVMPQVQVGSNDDRISEMGPDGSPSYGAWQPAAAYNPADNEYLVVWYGSDDAGALKPGEFEIYGQRIEATTGAEVGVNDFRISSMGPDGDADHGAIYPAVAYKSVDHEYMVVWAGDDVVDGFFQIHGQRIDAKTGAQVGGNDFLISDMLVDAFDPAVAHNFINNEYLVVCEGSDSIGATLDPVWEIFG